jgi:predicted secreted Zn-dependent protease
MTTPNAAAVTDAHKLVSTLEPLFYTLIRTAEHHELDTIQISLPRAREIQHELSALKKKLKNLATAAAANSITTDRHLDKMFGIN